MELNPRKEPVQARAKITYRKILDATALLLDEVGLEELNTNSIAKRADINISAIYKYFPNKYSILSTLAIKLNEKQTNLIINYLTTCDGSVPWEEMISDMIDVMIDNTRNEKGLIALQSAMLASPFLKDVYRKSNREISDIFIRALRMHGVVLPAHKSNLIGYYIGETASIMLDYSVSGGKRFDKEVIAELKRITIGYISTYLSPEVSP